MASIVRIPRAGEIIGGHFRLGSELGRGAFGVVFKAQQMDLDRQVAVKMLHPRALANKNVAERFKREARLISALSHPNTVVVYAFGEYGTGDETTGLPYMAMELLEGEDLHDYLAANGAVSVEQTISILVQTCGSLSEAHDKGIIHRDLKPENIFLALRDDEEAVVKILDFGIAKALNDSAVLEEGDRNLTGHGMVCGTPQYMAPEQATGERDLTPAVDVYAIGCIAYELICGEPPFTGRSPMDIALKHLSNPIPELPPEFEGSPLAEIITRALAKDPTERFADAIALEAALLEIAPTPLAPIPSPTPAPPVEVNAPPTPGARLPSLEMEDTLQLDEESETAMLDSAALAAGDVGDLGTGTSIIAAPLGPHSGELDAPRSSRAAVVAMIAVGALLLLGAIIAGVSLAVGDDSDDPAPVEAEADDAPLGGPTEVTITVDSTPAGAAVYDADVKIGETPLMVTRNKRPEPLVLTLRKDGYKETEREVQLQQDGAVEVSLMPAANEALAHKDPANAEAGDDKGADEAEVTPEDDEPSGRAKKRTPHRRPPRHNRRRNRRRKQTNSPKIELWN